MPKAKILIQLDTDPQPSSFDAVVATDAGVETLLLYGNVKRDQVRDLVYGAIFTRAIPELKNTAVFVGGSDVAAGESLLQELRATIFEPMTISAMIDSGGANTTAAAAVLSARRHLDLAETEALVLAATGPVGERVTRLLAAEGATVRAGSRDRRRAERVCQRVRDIVEESQLQPLQIDSAQSLTKALEGVSLVISAGTAGVQLLSHEARSSSGDLRVAIDLNAVPPLGIEGIKVTDKAANDDGLLCYGAVGVGGLKMKIHKQAIQRLFESNDVVLDAESIYQIGLALDP